MDPNSFASSALSLIALLLFAASNPLQVLGQIPPTPPVGIPPVGVPPVAVPPAGNPLLGPLVTLIVQGRLCCTTNGNCPGQGVGQGVVGVRVNLTCTNIFVSLTNIVSGQSQTDINGVFIITAQLQSVQGFILPFLCTVTTPLPVVTTTVNSCPALTTGLGLSRRLLSGVLGNGTLTSVGDSLVQNAVTTGFIMLL